MKIIQEIERGKSKSDVARELGLASSTVATIWKNRVSIAESWRNRDMLQSEGETTDLIGKKSAMSNIIIPSSSLSIGSMVMPTSPITTSPSLIPSTCPITPTSLCSSVSTSPAMMIPHQDSIQHQQAQTQTLNQELLEVRMTFYAQICPQFKQNPKQNNKFINIKH